MNSMKKSGSEYIAEFLESKNIDTVFTVAGDHILHLMDVLSNRGFRFIDTRHEQAAVDMANAWGRIKNTPGISMFTTPGHANAIPGLTLAHQQLSPVINISGCADSNFLGMGAPQEIDQIGMAAPVTKKSSMILNGNHLLSELESSYQLSLSGRRGPTHLTIPVDIQTGFYDSDDISVQKRGNISVQFAADDDVYKCYEFIEKSSNPVFILGNGAHDVIQSDIEGIVDTLNCPVLNEMSARGVIPDSHELSYGLSDQRANPTARAMSEADLIILLGKELDFTLDYGSPPTISKNTKIIQVDPDEIILSRSKRTDFSLLCSVGVFVSQLNHLLSTKNVTKKDPEIIKTFKNNYIQHMDYLKSLTGKGESIHSMDVHREMSKLLDDKNCLIFEGSDFAFYGASFYPSERSDRWFVNGVLGMIGWGVPYGIGAKVALPDEQVIVFTGDGASGFNLMEIDTAVRNNINAKIIIGCDSVWGIDYHQQVQFFENPVATNLNFVNYENIAKSVGAYGDLIEKKSELGVKLKKFLDHKGPGILNIKTEPSPSPLTQHILNTKEY